MKLNTHLFLAMRFIYPVCNYNSVNSQEDIFFKSVPYLLLSPVPTDGLVLLIFPVT